MINEHDHGAVPDDVGGGIESWDDLFALREETVHVVGAGSVEGAHLLLFLLDHGFAHLVGHDFSTPADFARAFTRVHVGWPIEQRAEMLARLTSGVRMQYRDSYLEGIEQADVIGVTQGWYLYGSNQRLVDDPTLRPRFLSLAQLYLALAPGIVVGVSGSQGKSTTTRLLGDMLRADGRTVLVTGNDRHGRQGLYELEQATAETILLMEVSNRHLKMLRRSPNVAVLTNVYPNHLEEHGGWDGYVEAKTRLVAHQQPGDTAVLNADLDVTRDMAARTPARVVWFGQEVGAGRGPDAPGSAGVHVGADELTATGLPASFSLSRADIPLAGDHNAMNVAAAVTAALAMGVQGPAIRKAIAGFRGLKHRVQFIWEADGVRFYDDLNSTTPTATLAALRTLGGSLIWIFGGEDKGLDSSDLAATARSTVRRAIALPGAGTRGVVKRLRAEGVEVDEVPTLEAAVRHAVEVAVRGDQVLLSPACPGFFSLYYVGLSEDTGFKKYVRDATTSPLARTPRRPAAPG